MESLQIRTGSRIELVDITAKVKQVVAQSAVQDGMVVVYVPHTTAAVTVNEAADPSVAEDIISKLSQLVPHNDRYRHTEGNSDAHVKTSIIGSSVHLIVSQGALMLGTWQGIFFCEFDGPRSRRVMVKVVAG